MANPDRYIYYLVTKERTGGNCLPTYQSLEESLRAMRNHIIGHQVKELAVRYNDKHSF